MIQTIKTSVELICLLIHYGLLISYKIGYFLVNFISIVHKYLAKLVCLLFDIFSAVLESFATFCQDVLQDIQNILRTVSSVDILMYLSDFKQVFHSFIFVIKSLSDLAINIILSVVIGIQTVLLSPKEAFIDLTAFFHRSVQFVFKKLEDVITGSVSFCITLPRTIYDFFTDIPLESIVCLMISCGLIYLFARFYIIMFSFLYRQLKKLFCNIRRRYIELQRHFGRRSIPERVIYRRQILPTRRPHIRTERRPTNLTKSEENDRYCVICQEQIKCVLLLPCRHLCMCNECMDTLQTYHNACPICRSHIESTMQIFV